MAVYDRWHRDPEPGAEPCKCGSGRRKLYPSSAHGRGARWQVRWDDPSAPKRRQPRRNFEQRDPAPGELADPEKHASVFDKLIQGQIVTRNYTDPKLAEVRLAEYAETWRKGRSIPNVKTAAKIESKLRWHVYLDPASPDAGRTPGGGIAIGQHPLALLASRPSMVAQWAASIPLAPGSKRMVLQLVSRIMRVAVADGIISRNPVKMPDVVEWPTVGATTARAWSLAQLEAMRAQLPERWQAMLDLGAGTGLRQGEMLGLGVDDIDWLVRKDPRVHAARQLQNVGGAWVFAPVKNRTPHHPPLTATVRDRLSRHLERYPPLEVSLPWHDPEDRERHGELITARLIFYSPARAPMWNTTLSSTWNAAAKRAKVTPPGGRLRDDGCHVLRHTAASTWLRGGIDVARVALWLGDTVETVVKTYVHVLPDDDDTDGRAAIEAFFAGPSSGSSALPVPSEDAK